MPRFLYIIFLLLFSLTVNCQSYLGKWTGAGEYLPGLSITAVMKHMAADKKLVFNIAPTGKVSGFLITSYKSKADVPHEGGDQNFTLTGKYDPAAKSLLLVVTHFKTKPDEHESYLTFMKPDSVYYDVSLGQDANGPVITGVANKTLNTNPTAEWVGSFRGGGLGMMDISDNSTMHILPLRIRLDNAVKPMVASDTAALAAIGKEDRVIQNKYALALIEKPKNNVPASKPVKIIAPAPDKKKDVIVKVKPKPVKEIKETPKPIVEIQVPRQNNEALKQMNAITELVKPAPARSTEVLAAAVTESKPSAKVVEAVVKVTAREKRIQKTITLDTAFIKLELYDNGVVDGDTATLIFDGKTIIEKRLLTEKAAVAYLTLSKLSDDHIIELFANSLGSIPPNTALLVITCKNKRYEINLSSTETSNGCVKLVFKTS